MVSERYEAVAFDDNATEGADMVRSPFTTIEAKKTPFIRV